MAEVILDREAQRAVGREFERVEAEQGSGRSIERAEARLKALAQALPGGRVRA